MNFQQTNKKLVVLTFFPKPIKLTYWVLVTGPLDQPIELLSISPGGSFLGMPDLMGKGDVSGYNMKILTVENSGCRVWKVPRSLHIQDSFGRFWKRVDTLTNSSHYKMIIVYLNPYFSCGSQKLFIQLSHSSSISLQFAQFLWLYCVMDVSSICRHTDFCAITRSRSKWDQCPNF